MRLNIKKTLASSCFFLLFTFPLCSAQNYLPGKIAYTPIFGDYTGFSEEICSLMEQRLTQIVLQNGLGSYSDQYVITARIYTEDKQVSSTVPPQYIIKLIIQFTALDVENDILVGEVSIPAKGVDKSETKAYLNAIKQLRPSNPAIHEFLLKSSKNILDAYNRNASKLMAQADQLASGGDYDGALAILASIPSDVDDYTQVQVRMKKVYSESLKKKAEERERTKEDAQREQDREMQIVMIQAMEKRNCESRKSATIEKVKEWFLGNLRFT